MGNANSAPDEEDDLLDRYGGAPEAGESRCTRGAPTTRAGVLPPPPPPPTHPTPGFRVLSVAPGSPAANVVLFPDAHTARDGLREAISSSVVAYLDVIVSVNGEPVDDEDVNFLTSQLQPGEPAILELYNQKHRRVRTVQIVPVEGGEGGGGRTGMTVLYDVIDPVLSESPLHVVEVAVGSPAALAGILPQDDFVLGRAQVRAKSGERCVVLFLRPRLTPHPTHPRRKGNSAA